MAHRSGPHVPRPAHESLRGPAHQGRQDPKEIIRSLAQVVCVGRDDAEVARRAAAIGRDVAALKEGGLAGTPAEVVDQIGRYREKTGITRLYLQVAPDEDLANWPDERIWQELRTRLDRHAGFDLADGPILDKGITALRSHVVEPMRHNNLFLAGDSAHIVPATGAKGLNLAVADVCVLAGAIHDRYITGKDTALDAYSATCLRRVWRVQHFSWWMTTMLHLPPDADPFTRQLQKSQLHYLTTSTAAATSFAENYVGLPLPKGG